MNMQKDYKLINFVADSLKGKLMKIKKEILAEMQETLACYLMLQVGTNKPSASEVTSKHCRRFPVLAIFCFMIGQATSVSR